MPNRLYNKQVTPKGYQKGGAVKKPKVRKIGAVGVGKAKDYPGIKEIIKMNKQGKKRFGMKMGGALKPVDPKTQKGLSKLPTEVRNKMGYMKDGGKVKKPGGFKSTQQKGNIVKGKLKSQKELKKITGSDAYKKASYGEKTEMLNRATHKVGGRVRKMGGGMSTARRDMATGYYKDDMGMKGGAMYKRGGSV